MPVFGRSEIAEMLKSHPASLCWKRIQETPRAKRILLAFLYHGDDRIRWRALETLAFWAAEKSTGELEQVRRVLRHLFWCMNDESGSICVSAPQAIGEILSSVPALAAEYIPMLASFIHEEPFEEGTLWALWRFGEDGYPMLRGREGEFVNLLGSTKAGILGHAILLLSSWRSRPCEDTLRRLRKDRRVFRVYDFRKGSLVERRVSEVACEVWGRGD